MSQLNVGTTWSVMEMALKANTVTVWKIMFQNQVEFVV